MEFKEVKLADDSVGEKSVQQVEQELLEKHEQSLNNVSEETEKIEPGIETPVETKDIIEETPKELTEEDVLKFIGNRYGREINSLDDLSQAREETEKLPEDVAAYFNYKKETGRGIKDFVELQKDYDEMSPDNLLKDYLTATEKGLDADDIEDLLQDYIYDEDLDDDVHIRKTKLAKKKTIAKAKEYFANQQEKYKIPLESRRDNIPTENAEELAAYKQYIAEAKTQEEMSSRMRQVFSERTDKVFSEFKGFEFTLDDNKVYFSPGDSNELKSLQSDPGNFIKKFLGEDGSVEDAVGYHKSLAMAMHPDKFAKFFYEQGKSVATDDQMKKLKNINMSSTRSAPEVGSTKSGTQIRSLDNDHGRGLKIQKRR